MIQRQHGLIGVADGRRRQHGVRPGFLAQIITAISAPTLGAMDSDDTPDEGFDQVTFENTANYASSAGTITSAVATVYVNGVAQTPSTYNQDLQPGDYVYVEILVSDDAGTEPRPFKTNTVRVTNAVALSISGSPATTATVGEAYSFTPTIAGGIPPYSRELASGALPDGLSFNASTGAITGTPTTEETAADLVLRVTDDLGATDNLPSFSITVSAVPSLTISGSPATSATIGQAYSFTPTVSGGTGPYTFSLASGTLPAGLSLNTSTGAITGSPTTEETAVGLVLRVTDANSDTADLASFQIEVSAAAEGPSIEGLDNGDYQIVGDQVIVSGLGAPYDGTYALPGDYSDPGYLVAPYVTGAPGVGNVLTAHQGISYSESETTVCTYTLKRGGVAFLSDQPMSLDHTTEIDYTQLADDKANGGVTIEITLNDGDSTSMIEMTFVAPSQPAVISSAPGATTTPLGDIFSDGRSWTLYEIVNTGTEDLTGDLEFSQIGEFYVSLVGGGCGGSTREFSTVEADFGGTGAGAGEVTDFVLTETLTLSEAFSIGRGGPGADIADKGVGSSVYGTPGNDTSFLALTAGGGQPTTDGSGTYVSAATLNNNKGGGAGAGGDGLQAGGYQGSGIYFAGNGGPPKTVTLGSYSYTAGYGGGAGPQNSTWGYQGGAGNGADGAGMNYNSSGTVFAATPGVDGSGDGGGSSCKDADGTNPVRLAAKGGNGSLKIIVEDAA